MTASEGSMGLSPRVTQVRKFVHQSGLDTPNFSGRKSEVLSQFYWTIGTMEAEHSFTLIANDVNMRRTMIIWVNHDAQAADTQNGRHAAIIPITQAVLVIVLAENRPGTATDSSICP
jgi:hypothetical protein